MADYIDRYAVYHAISVDGRLNAYEKAFCIDIVRKITAADVAPVRHGQWKMLPYTELYKNKCSSCGNGSDLETDYCPNCGARMDGGDKNDE